MNQEQIDKWLPIIGGGAVVVIVVVMLLFLGPGSRHAEERAAESRQAEHEYRENEQQLADERLRKERESKLAATRFRLLLLNENRPTNWGGYRFSIRTEGIQAGHHRGWVVNSNSLPPGLFIPSELSRVKLAIEVQNIRDKPSPFPFADSGRLDSESNSQLTWSPIAGIGFSNTSVLATIRSPRFIDLRAAAVPAQAATSEAAAVGDAPPFNPVASPKPSLMIDPRKFASTIIEQPLHPEPMTIQWYLRFRPGISDELEGIAIETNPNDHGFGQYELGLSDAAGIPRTP